MTAGLPNWATRFGFLMASAGFAVGLGNIWRFPYVTGENGGSAFVLVYLVCTVAMGVPILMAEIMLGRSGRAAPPGVFARLAGQQGRLWRWQWVGYLNLLTAFTIVCGYVVVAGWVLHYLGMGLRGTLVIRMPQFVDARFTELLSDPFTLSGWMLAVLAVAGGIVYAGVGRGIERSVLLLMPLLFLLLLGLVGFNLMVGGVPAALDYLFRPDFSKFSAAMLLAAVSQAFFSIGVAMAGMMMYGAYLPASVPVGRSALMIVLADTGVALLAGLVIFPMVFHNGLDPAGGTGLIFQTLPVAFAQMPGGAVVAVVFFLLLAVAAVTSVVGFLEPLVVWLSTRFACSRRRALALLLVAVALGAELSVLGYNRWQDVVWLGQSVFWFVDFIPNQVLLPLGGLLIAVFAGWRLDPTISRAALALPEVWQFRLWHKLMRFVVVPAVGLILVTGIVA